MRILSISFSYLFMTAATNYSVSFLDKETFERSNYKYAYFTDSYRSLLWHFWDPLASHFYSWPVHSLDTSKTSKVSIFEMEKKLDFCFSWWPFFVVIFYLLSPIPTLISKRYSDGINESSALKEACAFFTTGIVLSAFGLPLVLARAPVAAPTVSFTAY